MRLSHTLGRISTVFDDPNLVGPAGLVPVMGLAGEAGLRELGDVHLTVPTDKGANAGLKVSSLVAGMVAGADSIDDMALLRHGGMGRLFTGVYAPSTLGSFLRAFTFGHVRQLDAVAARFLLALARRTRLVTPPAGGEAGFAFVDVDDTVIEVHGHAKQGAGFGYNKIRGLNALLATVTGPGTAPVIVAQRLRRGSCSSPRGGKRLIGDAVKTSRRLLDPSTPVLVRMDSAFYGRNAVQAALTGGAEVSVTIRMDQRVKATISSISEDAWTTIEYTDAVFDETSGQWISRAEVAEIGFTAFATQPAADQVPGRLIVRRIPDFQAEQHRAAGQDGLFDMWRFHAFFTTTSPEVLDTVTADKIHRRHAIIEQIHADLKNSALAHLPSGKFTANAAWLVLAVIAFNLTRAAATLAAPTSASDPARATTATVRRTLIQIPCRIATSARRLTLHLPQDWPWQTGWNRLITGVAEPPAAAPS
ncbi:MAG TPA: IS1380 family transposase [Microlunatus sp.]|nr:IS1380 family transposase [Microlunatus sp.]